MPISKSDTVLKIARNAKKSMKYGWRKEVLKNMKKHFWESISEERKNKGGLYRKAKPGSWQENLTPEQAKIVEWKTAPHLKAFCAEHTL